jgi:hypothetical protein
VSNSPVNLYVYIINFSVCPNQTFYILWLDDLIVDYDGQNPLLSMMLSECSAPFRVG